MSGAPPWWRDPLGCWRRHRLQRALARRAIPEPLWQQTMLRLPFIAVRPPQHLQQLRTLCSLFLDRKQFSGAGGLEITDEIALAIAMQACLPVLGLGLAAYDGFVGIVVHPDGVIVTRQHLSDDGVVHEYEETLAGEAVAGGPLMLSWRDVQAAGAGDGARPEPYSVVIHEFAHVLDMGDGQADGVPPLPGGAAARARWQATLERCWRQFCRAVDEGRDTLLDPYAAEAPEEFFAVASEAFFVCPQALREASPSLYRLLAGYYRQDPAAP
ncbi:MAG: hypothetical protein RIQ53_2415 [Pseudomonadota bacterium]|jgi:Mlc titration factor MtfA (ptsG expression regulator)